MKWIDKWRTTIWAKWIIYVSLAIILFVTLMGNVVPKKVDIKLGSNAPENIISPVEKVDHRATELAKQRAIDNVKPQYELDERIMEGQIQRVDSLFNTAKRLNRDTTYTEEERIKIIKTEESFFDLNEEMYLKIARTTPEELSQIQLTTRDIIKELMTPGLQEKDLVRARDRIDEMLVTIDLNSNARFIVRELARKSLTPNVLYDEEKTAQIKQEMEENVEPVVIKKKQILASKGEMITEEIYRLAGEVGLLKNTTNPWPYAGLGIVVTLMILSLYFYIEKNVSVLNTSNTQLLMLAIIFSLNLISMKLFSIAQSIDYSIIAFLAPVSFGAMLITILIDMRFAIIYSFLMSIAASVIFNIGESVIFDFRYGIVVFIGSIAAAFVLSKATQRTSILRAGFIVAAIQVLTICSLYMLVEREYNWREITEALLYGIGSGLFSSVLTIGFIPFFEVSFGILSSVKLIELSNPNHPLLRKILLETPGTYHHSVIVGNLSEAACEAIGANGLLARVGAYYHDVGKTKRPHFFIENQMKMENPHDNIAPSLSRTIIISHPRDGVEMLREYNIPKAIRDIAEQHHGTTLLKFFYHKALKQDESGNVTEAEYRYPGPKAQSKEAAIVGIADCIEAAVRSLSQPTQEQIETMVRKIIKDRLEDGQFDDCDITMKELNIAAQAICETLHGIFHSRIKYPTDEELKGGVASGN